MGLTRAWISMIADELLADGILEERPQLTAQRGRAPTPLALRSDAYFAGCAAISRSGCRIGIVNIGGDVLAEKEIRTDCAEGGSEKLALLADALEKMLADAGLPENRLLGVGVSAPGPLDAEEGRILNPPRFDAWHGVDLVTPLKARLGIPVYLANLATACAVYCHHRPETADSDNFLLLIVNEGGVGSGIISQGKLLHSAGRFTSELGHVSIDYRGRPCSCGNTGCLEMYAAIPRILEEAGGRYTSWRDAVDRGADDVIRREAQYLAAGIAAAVNMINVDTVLLAGDILYGFDRISAEISAELSGRLLPPGASSLRILPAPSGAGIDILCAGDIVFSRFLNM